MKSLVTLFLMDMRLICRVDVEKGVMLDVHNLLQLCYTTLIGKNGLLYSDIKAKQNIAVQLNL